MKTKDINPKTQKEVVKTPDSGKNLVSSFHKHKNKLMLTLAAAAIIPVALMFYAGAAERDKSAAWTDFSFFQKNSNYYNSYSTPDMLDFLNNIKGTSAEPWGLYYCSIIYFNQGLFSEASSLLDRLCKEHSGHYVCKLHSLHELASLKTTDALAWKEKNQNIP